MAGTGVRTAPPEPRERLRSSRLLELGTRYQVAYSAWTPLGTTVLAVELNGPGLPASLLLPFAAAPWDATAGNWEALTDPWAESTDWPDTTSGWTATSTNWESLA